MARGNDLKLTPAHNSQLPPLVATSPGGAANFSEPDILSDDVEFFSGSEGNTDLPEARPGDDPRAQIKGRYVHHGDQEDEEENAEGLAGLINDASLSGLSHQSPAMVSKPRENILGKVLAIFTPHKQPKTAQASTNPESLIKPQRGSGQILRSTEQTISAIDKEVPAPIGLASETISLKKKPKASGRPDIYDVPQSLPGSPDVGTKVINGQKRNTPKLNKLVVREKEKGDEMNVNEDVSLEGLSAEEQEHVEMAKQTRSLRTRAVSVTSKQLASPQRITRSSGTKGSKSITFSQRPEKTAHQLPDGSPGLGRPSASQTPKPKAKRGRPRKDQNSMNQTQRPAADSAAIDNASARFEKSAELDSVDANDILRDLGPINVVQQQPIPKEVRKLMRPSRAGKDAQGVVSSKHTPKAHHEPGLARLRDPESFRIAPGKYQPETASISDHYDSFDDENDSLFHEEDVSSNCASHPKAETAIKSKPHFIDEQIMDGMVSHMKLVGRNKDNQMAVTDKGFATAIGKQMSKAAEKLVSEYTFMEELKSADVVDLQKVSSQQQTLSALLAKLEALAGTVLNNQLGVRSTGVKIKDGTSRKKMLQDLYMHVIPKTVDALYASAERYWKQPTFDTVDLEEFTALLKVVFDLAKAARAEHSDVQPKAPKSHSYKLAGPTTLLLPIARTLLKKCTNELAARKAQEARKVAARKRKQLSKEQERADEEDYLRRLMERNKAILHSLNKIRANLGLPSSGHQNGAQTNSQPNRDIVDNEEFSDQNGDAKHERLSLFGRNNSHPEKIPREWTKEEMRVLVDVLWRERGK